MAEKLAQTNKKAAIAIILVNWNGWNDTIECLESIFKNNCDDFFVIVCDNDSSDGSVEKIRAWAAGSLPSAPVSAVMAPYSTPHIPKPLPLKFVDHDGTASGDSEAKFVLIQTGDNLGFAGGNNVGMRYALENSSCEYFWLLNNDTVIKHDAISHLIDHMKASNNVGMCGTRIHFYHQPDTIQALGGAKYNKWTGTSKCIGNYLPIETEISNDYIVNNSDFIVGASMVLTRPFLNQIGLMEESYFLYYEEIDWSTRANDKFETGYAPEAIIYHKEGGAIGSSSKKGARSELSEYYLMRSKIKFTTKFYPVKLITIYLYGVGQIFVRLIRKKKNLSKAIANAMFE